MQAIKDYLLDWNGKDISYLQAILPTLEKHSDLVLLLTDWSQEQPSLLPAITWIIKQHLDQQQQFSSNQGGPLLSLFPLADVSAKWEPRLHLLQCLPQLDLEISTIENLLPYFDRWSHSTNKFVRAWAYNALGLAAQQIPELIPEVKERFLLALEEESAAVKARVRKALTQLG